MRLVIARCSVDYAGRLSAHLPLATRLLMLKADGSLLVHSDGGSYKPLNWMSPPCSIEMGEPSDEQAEAGITQVWTVTQKKTQDKLVVSLYEVIADETHDLGVDPGLVKDGVEAHLQQLLAEQIELLGDGHTLVRREYMTAIGPVDILARDDAGASVAVEMKRNANIDAVEQLTRYLELMNRDPLLRPVQGVLAAQTVAPQAAPWPRTAASASSSSTTTRCAASRAGTPACSDARVCRQQGRETRAFRHRARRSTGATSKRARFVDPAHPQPGGTARVRPVGAAAAGASSAPARLGGT